MTAREGRRTIALASAGAQLVNSGEGPTHMGAGQARAIEYAVLMGLEVTGHMMRQVSE